MESETLFDGLVIKRFRYIEKNINNIETNIEKQVISTMVKHILRENLKIEY